MNKEWNEEEEAEAERVESMSANLKPRQVRRQKALLALHPRTQMKKEPC